MCCLAPDWSRAGHVTAILSSDWLIPSVYLIVMCHVWLLIGRELVTWQQYWALIGWYRLNILLSCVMSPSVTNQDIQRCLFDCKEGGHARNYLLLQDNPLSLIVSVNLPVLISLIDECMMDESVFIQNILGSSCCHENARVKSDGKSKPNTIVKSIL